MCVSFAYNIFPCVPDLMYFVSVCMLLSVVVVAVAAVLVMGVCVCGWVGLTWQWFIANYFYQLAFVKTSVATVNILSSTSCKSLCCHCAVTVHAIRDVLLLRYGNKTRRITLFRSRDV